MTSVLIATADAPRPTEIPRLGFGSARWSRSNGATSTSSNVRCACNGRRWTVRFGCSTRLQSARTLETSLTTSAVSRDTFSVQAAGAGSHKPRVGGGGRVAGGERCRMSTPQRSKRLTASLTVLPTKHLFGHDGTMMTRANSRRTGGGSPIHFAGHRFAGPHLHTGIPAYRPHRAVAS